DDPHVQASLDRVVEERGVDRLAYHLVAAERERDVADTTRCLATRKQLLETANGLDELDGVVGVFLHAGADREDVHIENNVLGRETDLLGEQVMDSLTNSDLVIGGDGLALLVEGHDHDCGTIAADRARLRHEALKIVFDGDGVDNRLALDALQASLDDL